MTNTKRERKIFWTLFEEILAENGNPFSIAPQAQWAVINRNNSNCAKPCLLIDFLVRKRIIRINVYIDNDLSLYKRLEIKKEEIKNALGFQVEWAIGSKGENTRRIKMELGFILGSREDYRRVIKKVLPIVMNFIEVFKRDINCT